MYDLGRWESFKDINNNETIAIGRIILNLKVKINNNKAKKG